ncbi:MAG: ribosomal protein S18-alanine N-acetyltransferase [Parvularculaceae bacterium]|nr:ribosomal protein S18-alanine N-acetyltransferase [Parvularculaceae bacterium]
MIAWRLRPAARGDADCLVQIEAAAFGPASWGGRSIADGLSERLVSTIVAENADGAAAGFLMWRGIGEEAEILTLAVAPKDQRRGCAKALVAEFVETARGEGVRSLFLEVDAGNKAAIALYERMGFSRIGRRVRYYKSGADALVMRVDL